MRFLGPLFLKAVVVVVVSLLTLPAWSRYDDYMSCEEPVISMADGPASAPLGEEIPQEDGHSLATTALVMAPEPGDAALVGGQRLHGLDSHDVNARDSSDRLFRPPRQR